jgi:ABC-2 type transport system permease protein
LSTVRAIVALLTAGWRTTTSYRVRFIFSMASVLVTTIPVFFIARAIQPIMARSIAGEGSEYFAFLLLGFVVLVLVQVAGEALPHQVAGDIGNGFFEAMTAAPVGTPAVLAGLAAYPLAFATSRGVLTLGIGALLGIDFVWSHLPAGFLILALLILAHLGVGLTATAGVVLFRSTFAIPQAFSTGSAFLGGALWPTSVIPSWLQSISDFLPLTYGLRALRKVLLEGASLSAVSDDVATLGAMAGLLFVVGVATLSWAIDRARKVGSLSQY